MGRWLVVAIAVVAGCGAGTGGAVDADRSDGADPDVPSLPCSDTIGDRSLPIEVVPVVGTRDSAATLEIADGGDVPLIPPFQGGFIILAGGKVRNLDGCTADVTASIRDPINNQVIGLEQRPSRLVIGDDGWGHPSGSVLYALANVALCPNFGGARDVQDQPWLLEVRYATPDGRSGTAIREVVPRCAAQDLDCACLCDADFSGGCEAPGG